MPLSYNTPLITWQITSSIAVKPLNKDAIKREMMQYFTNIYDIIAACVQLGF